MYTIKREISASNVNKDGYLHLHEAFNFMLDICAFHMDEIKSLNDFFIETIAIGWFVVVDIVINTAVTDFISGFDNLVNVIGNFVYFTIG